MEKLRKVCCEIEKSQQNKLNSPTLLSLHPNKIFQLKENIPGEGVSNFLEERQSFRRIEQQIAFPDDKDKKNMMMDIMESADCF